MKKYIFIITLVVFAMIFTACSSQNDDVLHLGLDAFVQEIDIEKNCITINGTDNDIFVKSSCEVSCDDINMIYCNYKTGEIKRITIEDLQKGDEIILGVKESEMSKYINEKGVLKVEQLQLGTQRLN